VRQINRNLSAPVVLGLSALATNIALLLVLSGQSLLPAGNIFLFCAAGALSPAYTLIAAALGSFPIALWNGEYFEAFRLLALCLGLSVCAVHLPKIPAFVLTALAWTLIFIPTTLLWNAGADSALSIQLAFGVMSETLFAMIAGALLLNTSVWGAITQRPRHVALASLLTHFLAITATVVMLAVMSMQVRGSLILNDSKFDASLLSMGILVLLCVCLPLYLGWRLARRIGFDSQELLGMGSALGRTTTFSNMSVDLRRAIKGNDSQRSEMAKSSGGTEGALPIAVVKELPSALSADLGICALNRNGTITFVNRRFRQLAEMSSNEVLGKRIENVDLNPTLRTHILELIEATFTRGPRALEVKLNRLPDKLRYFEISTRRPDELENSSLGDGPESLILTVKDITDRRTVESHLLQAQKLSSLAPLLNNLAHSFNNTLTAIIGQASYALRLSAEDKRNQALQCIISASQEAGALVNKLLEFTTSKPGDIKTGDMRTLVSSRLELLKKILGPQHELIFASPEIPLPVACDSNLIFQAITNLVTNSRESYQGKTGSIEVTLAEELIEQEAATFAIGAKAGEYVRLRVRDFGCGMNAETLGKSFNPLYTTKHTTGHIGLGLSIVYSIVRAHDGFLTVESHPDKGTTVSLYFPKAEHVMQHISEALTPRDKMEILHAAAHERILVVEDEQNVRDLVTTMLRLLGYEVISCSSGQEALEYSAQKDFDLYLVDMVLPKLDGVALVEKLRNLKPASRALIMTGFGNSIDTSATSAPIIPKPFDIETLSRAVRSSLGESRTAVQPRSRARASNAELRLNEL
jgi:PAS domain S-box-containing protein